MSIRLIAIACCLLTVCAGAQEEKKSDPLVGTTDDSGNVILHVFDAGEGDKRPAALSSDYGIVMCRSGDWVLFALGDRAKKTVQEFTNYDRFLEALKALPKGATITIYDRCQVPRFYDFYPVHQELYQKFGKASKKMGLKIAEDPNITCTCEEAPAPAPAPPEKK